VDQSHPPPIDETVVMLEPTATKGSRP
jgi:hypothetical protein